jgi:hypothetical protein
MLGSNFSGEGGGAQGLTSERWLMWERCVSLRERNFCWEWHTGALSLHCHKEREILKNQVKVIR